MALAFVEGKVIDNINSVATTPAFTNTFQPGQLVVITAIFDGGSDTTTSITDNATTHATYTKVAGASLVFSTRYMAVYYGVWAATKASPTVTLNYDSSGTNVDVAVQYFNGFVGAPTLDVSKVQSNATASTTVTSGTSGTTARSTELIVGHGGYTGTVTTFALGSGYTNLTSNNVVNRAVAMESALVTVTGTQTATFTLAVAKSNVGAVTTWYDAASAVANPGQFFAFF